MSKIWELLLILYKSIDIRVLSLYYSQKLNIQKNIGIIMKDYMNFLTLAESLNTKYASIYFNCELESLTMPFWSWSEIQAGLEQRKEWEVCKTLIPFYGDWHDLFCLDGKSGVIVALNDKRDVLCSWSSVNEFLSCLSEEEITYGDMRGVVHDSDESKRHEMMN